MNQSLLQKDWGKHQNQRPHGQLNQHQHRPRMCLHPSGPCHEMLDLLRPQRQQVATRQLRLPAASRRSKLRRLASRCLKRPATRRLPTESRRRLSPRRIQRRRRRRGGPAAKRPSRRVRRWFRSRWAEAVSRAAGRVGAGRVGRAAPRDGGLALMPGGAAGGGGWPGRLGAGV